MYDQLHVSIVIAKVFRYTNTCYMYTYAIKLHNFVVIYRSRSLVQVIFLFCKKFKLRVLLCHLIKFLLYFRVKHYIPTVHIISTVLSNFLWAMNIVD